MKLELDKIYHIDCLEGMRLMKEQGITADWCITDPPYGIGEDGKKNHSRGNTTTAKAKAAPTLFTPKNWDKKRIEKPYFDIMFEVSKEQIIFGGNYYTDYLPPSSCWIVWDKVNYGTDFADCEMAWSSYKGAVRLFRYMWNGMLQGNMKNKEKRIHPTQKPLPLIEWILNKYTKEGDVILDPFIGSGTTAVACHKLKRKYIGFELDEEYFELASKRIEEAKSQLSIFDLV